ncbi:MAG: hypothetical protein M1820_002620 [Bogoriella megaspora]|nr:MAG: hypothetical protein M1820_002620 [Bogoriella megaspora]
MFTFTRTLNLLSLFASLLGLKLHNVRAAPVNYSQELVEAPSIRSYFYVGGHYVTNASDYHLYSNQLYVESLVPVDGITQSEPIVFLHGQAQTGTNWLNTPDGREGWASWFIRRGYHVYIVDQPQRGRSAYLPGDGELGTFSAENISMLFTGVQYFNQWPQAQLHTQWPGTGLQGDPIFDQFYASQVQYQSNATTVQQINQQAGAALLDRIGPANLIVHSQGGLLGLLIADARPSLVKALVALEPQGPPYQPRIGTSGTGVLPYGLSSIPIAYNPPVQDPTTDLQFQSVPSAGYGLVDCYEQASPVRQLSNLSQVPMLVVTSEASFHAQYDYCTAKYLKQGGVDVQYFNLSQAGFHGNAHFVFMEKNNLEIVEPIAKWIQDPTCQIVS